MTPEQVAAQQAAASGSNADVMAAIQGLKTDLEKSFDARLTAQQADFDEKLKPVTDIQETLEQARKNQADALERQRQQTQPKYVPKTWEEVRRDAAEDAYQRTEAERKQREQQQTAEQTRKANDEAQMERDIDQSLQALEQSGYLPAIYNPNDPNDPGVASRRELIGAATHMGTPELDKVAATLTELHRQNMLFDPSTKTYISAENSMAPLPGKFAPVGNSSTNSPSRFQGPTTKDLRHSSMDDLVALAEQRGYGPVPTSVLDQPGGF